MKPEVFLVAAVALVVWLMAAGIICWIAYRSRPLSKAQWGTVSWGLIASLLLYSTIPLMVWAFSGVQLTIG